MNLESYGRVRVAMMRLVWCAVVYAGLIAFPSVQAAVTDCEGMSVDGQAKCIAPTYSPIQYSACDLGSDYLYIGNTKDQCRTELGLTSPFASEAIAVEFANCVDKKLESSGTGVTGAVPWQPAGTTYNDSFCYGTGSVREVEGYILSGYGTKQGGFRTWAFSRKQVASCPTGHTLVSKVIRGTSELVRCKPQPPCTPDKELRANSQGQNVCLTKKQLPANQLPPSMCAANPSPGGAGPTPAGGVGDPIYPMTGAMQLSLGSGFRVGGVELILTYDTSRKQPGSFIPRKLPSFGELWSSNFHQTLGVSSDRKVVTAYRGNGSVLSFSLQNGSYVSESNVDDRVVALAQGFLYTDASEMRVETYNAQGQMTRWDGADGNRLVFSYSTAASALYPDAGYLREILDERSGRLLKFEYVLPERQEVLTATKGLISRITDAQGYAIGVGYEQGNLKAVTWPDNKTVEYLYENTDLPWAITGRVDESGTRNGTWSYDALGRATGTSLPLGVEAYSVTYDAPPAWLLVETEDFENQILYQRYTIRKPQGVSMQTPNGSVAVWETISVLGRPLLKESTQPAGSGCAAATSEVTHDPSTGNVTSRVDFAGSRTCYKYDGNREISRIEGLAADAPCDDTVPADARRITTAWHPEWQLPVEVVEPLRRTKRLYHGQEDPPNSGTFANCREDPALPNAKLPGNKSLPLLCRVVEEALTLEGNLDSRALARTTRFTYDDAGRVRTEIDPMGRVTTYAYYTDTVFAGAGADSEGHSIGDLRTISKAGQITRFRSYDKAGRVLRIDDPKGIVITVTYTPRGWLKTRVVTPPGMQPRETIFHHDHIGQVTKADLPDGTFTTITYDAAGRPVGSTDVRGNAVTYLLDVAGNRVKEEVRDAAGTLQRTITRSFDALNRMQEERLGSADTRTESTLALTALPAFPVINRPLTFTATVTGTTPNGVVTFSDGAGVIGSSQLVDGSASLSTVFDTPGVKGITANYGGDGNSEPSSAFISVSVAFKLPTTTSFNWCLPVSLEGRFTYCHAVVETPAPLENAGAASMIFFDGAALRETDQGLLTLSPVNGMRRYEGALGLSDLSLGTHYLQAKYPGDATTEASESSVQTHTVVNKITTFTTMDCNRQSGLTVSCYLTVGSDHASVLYGDSGEYEQKFRDTPLEIWKVTPEGKTLLTTITRVQYGQQAGGGGAFSMRNYQSTWFTVELPLGQHDLKATYPGTNVTLPSESVPTHVY